MFVDRVFENIPVILAGLTVPNTGQEHHCPLHVVLCVPLVTNPVIVYLRGVSGYQVK